MGWNGGRSYQLVFARSKCRFAALPIGDTSPDPFQAVRMPNHSQRPSTVRAGVSPPIAEMVGAVRGRTQLVVNPRATAREIVGLISTRRRVWASRRAASAAAGVEPRAKMKPR